MKTLRHILAFTALACALLATPLGTHGCKSQPSARVTEVTTLKVLGASVDATMRLAANLLLDKKITTEQWRKVADVHLKFQATYNVAVTAVQSDLSSLASPDLMNMAGQLSALVASLTAKPSP